MRVYEPTLGRFLQADPIQNGSANAYDYTSQDPVNMNDLSGAVTQNCVLTLVFGPVLSKKNLLFMQLHVGPFICDTKPVSVSCQGSLEMFSTPLKSWQVIEHGACEGGQVELIQRCARGSLWQGYVQGRVTFIGHPPLKESKTTVEEKCANPT
jgi:hypothetical protein